MGSVMDTLGLKLRLGEVEIIRVQSPSAGGYSWGVRFEIEEDPVAEAHAEGYEASSNSASGNAVQIFKVTARRPGKIQFPLVERCTWELTKPPLREMLLEVEVLPL